jgi:hypothetical protein
MLSLDLSEARDISERAARGDADAIAFLSSLFPDTEPYLLCDEPVGAGIAARQAAMKLRIAPPCCVVVESKTRT